MNRRLIIIALLSLSALVGLLLSQKTAFAMVIEWGGNPDATSTQGGPNQFAVQGLFSNTTWYETTTTIGIYITNLTGGYPPVEPMVGLALTDNILEGYLAVGYSDNALAGGQTKFITFTISKESMENVIAAGWNNPTSTRWMIIYSLTTWSFHVGKFNGTESSFCPPDYFGWKYDGAPWNWSARTSDGNIGCVYYIVQIGQTTWIPPSLPTALITSSTPQIQITCNPGDAWYQYSICKMLTWLFIPSQTDFTNFGGLIDFIKTKPPVGYFYAIQNALYGLNSTTTPQVSLQLGSVSDYVFSPFRTAFIWILWLEFGVYLFIRIKHLEL